MYCNAKRCIDGIGKIFQVVNMVARVSIHIKIMYFSFKYIEILKNQAANNFDLI